MMCLLLPHNEGLGSQDIREVWAIWLVELYGFYYHMAVAILSCD